jgi:hypothetical protein
MRIHWKKDLKSPKTPGHYPVQGVGLVLIDQLEIDIANEYIGNCYFDIVETPGFSAGTEKYFICSQAIPIWTGGNSE